jgi:hypothetical protein
MMNILQVMFWKPGGMYMPKAKLKSCGSVSIA